MATAYIDPILPWLAIQNQNHSYGRRNRPNSAQRFVRIWNQPHKSCSRNSVTIPNFYKGMGTITQLLLSTFKLTYYLDYCWFISTFNITINIPDQSDDQPLSCFTREVLTQILATLMINEWEFISFFILYTVICVQQQLHKYPKFQGKQFYRMNGFLIDCCPKICIIDSRASYHCLLQLTQ